MGAEMHCFKDFIISCGDAWWDSCYCFPASIIHWLRSFHVQNSDTLSKRMHWRVGPRATCSVVAQHFGDGSAAQSAVPEATAHNTRSENLNKHSHYAVKVY